MTAITDLPGLTWHVTKPLAAAGITTTEQLAALTTDDLEAVPGMGPRRVHALMTALREAE